MVRLKINGPLALGKNLATVSGAIAKPQLAAIVTRAAEPMRSRMGELAPRSNEPKRMGHLADNIVTEIVTDAAEVTVAVGPAWRFWYARYDEFGTVKESAKPFMRPAFDATQDESFALIAANVWPLMVSAVATPTETAP
jgi:HK97 gp10 family phage protein